MDFKILVTGGRFYNNKKLVYSVLDEFLESRDPKSIFLGHGGAKGADSLAGKWAIERAIRFGIWEAEWTKYGNRAGPIRNSLMLEELNPDVVVAFPGEKGTADMVRKAISKGTKVIKVEEE